MPKEYQLGVLLVHGIGAQRSGETLIHWGDAILKTIESATGKNVQVLTGPSKITSETDGNAQSVVQLKAGDKVEKWLIAEGWWAEAFMSPSYGELVSWSVQALPWTFALHFAQKFWLFKDDDKSFNAAFSKIGAGMLLIIAMMLSPFFIALLAIFLIVGLVPIPQIRSVILGIQRTLVASVGDSLAFLESPMRAGLIRTKVINELTRLKDICDKTIVIAHSQGAAVVIDSLGGILEPVQKGEEIAFKDPIASELKPDRLITFGAGINKLSSLKAIKNLKEYTQSVAMIFVVGIVALETITGVLSYLVISDKLSLLEVLRPIGAYLVFYMLPFSLLTAGLGSLIKRLSLKWAFIDKYGVGIATAIILGCLMVAIYFADRNNIPVFWPSISFMVLLMVVGSVSSILSKRLAYAIATIKNPMGNNDWFDFYASVDPVPNGEIRFKKTDPAKSTEIWNNGSMLTDHTSYWNNTDCFVLPVVRICAETAGSSWIGQLPTEEGMVRQREHSKWRVGWLKRVRGLITVSWIFIGLLIWFNHKGFIPELIAFMPAWLTGFSSQLKLTELVLLIIFLCVLSNQLAFSIWRIWVKNQQEDYLSNRQLRAGWVLKILLAMLTLVIITVALVLVRMNEQEVVGLFSTWESLQILIALFGLAALSIFIGKRMWPSPVEEKSDRP